MKKKGQNAFNKFVASRLEKESASVSIRDPMVKMKLKMFSTCNKEVKCNLSDKVVKLREDRSLLARFLVFQQCRPELGAPLKEAIGQYKFSVFPRLLFSSDGMLLLPSDKSSFMKVIKEFPAQDISSINMDNLESARTNSTQMHVCIIDGMAVVKSIKKGASMITCLDFDNSSGFYWCSSNRTNAAGLY